MLSQRVGGRAVSSEIFRAKLESTSGIVVLGRRWMSCCARAIAFSGPAGNVQRSPTRSRKAPQTDMPKVAICICTFRRPQLLRELLEAIGRLKFRTLPAPEVEVIVVDNDELKGGEQVASE